VEVIGMTILRSDPIDPMQSVIGSGHDPGLSIHLRIKNEDKFFVGIEQKACKLIHFLDDKGSDLAEQDPMSFEGGWLRGFPQVAQDGHSCIVNIGSGRIPSPEAREIAIKGNIAATCGSGEQTVRKKNFALKEGNTLNVGSINLRVDNVGRLDWGDAKMEVEFSSKQDLSQIKKLDFFDLDGQKIDSERTGSAKMGFAGNMTYMHTYALKKQVDAVTLSVIYFNKVETVVIPIDIRTSVGLGQFSSEKFSHIIRPASTTERGAAHIPQPQESSRALSRNQEILFQDSFDKSGVFTGIGEWLVETNEEEAWHIERGKLIGHSDKTASRSVAFDTRPEGDVEIHTDVSFKVPPRYITFRVDYLVDVDNVPAKTYRGYLRIKPDSLELTAKKLEKGQLQDLDKDVKTFSGLDGQKDFVVKLTRVGTKFFGQLQADEVHSVSLDVPQMPANALLRSVSIYAGCYGGTVVFDNFKITRPQ